MMVNLQLLEWRRVILLHLFQIFSRLHGALRVDLIDTVSSEDDIHIHQVLIAEGFAQATDESYDSIVSYSA
jgi:hypothetical protein